MSVLNEKIVRVDTHIDPESAGIFYIRVSHPHGRDFAADWAAARRELNEGSQETEKTFESLVRSGWKIDSFSSDIEVEA